MRTLSINSQTVFKANCNSDNNNNNNNNSAVNWTSLFDPVVIYNYWYLRRAGRPALETVSRVPTVIFRIRIWRSTRVEQPKLGGGRGGDCRIVFTHVTTAIPAYAETDYFDAGVREFPGRRGRNAVTIARVFITRQHDIIIYYYIIVLGGPCSTPAAIICSNTSASCPALYSRTSARCWWWRRRAGRPWPAADRWPAPRVWRVRRPPGGRARAVVPTAPTVSRTRRCGRPARSTWPPARPALRPASRPANAGCPVWPRKRWRWPCGRCRPTARPPYAPRSHPGILLASPDTWTLIRPATGTPCPTRNPAKSQ